MSNEAAERLRSQLRGWITESGALAHAEANLNDALAAERRATVERMRPFFERLADYFDTNGDTATGDALRATWRKAHDAILDEEAAR